MYFLCLFSSCSSNDRHGPIFRRAMADEKCCLGCDPRHPTEVEIERFEALLQQLFRFFALLFFGIYHFLFDDHLHLLFLFFHVGFSALFSSIQSSKLDNILGRCSVKRVFEYTFPLLRHPAVCGDDRLQAELN